jgi:predicted Zn-dependent peptidase
MAELVRVNAFGGKGIGMPNSGLGQILTNEDFLDFQRKFITPHKTVISLSNLKNPDEVIKSIKRKIKEDYPECRSFLI